MGFEEKKKLKETAKDHFVVFCTKCEKQVKVYDNQKSGLISKKFICENDHFGQGIYKCEQCSSEFFHNNSRKYCSKCLTTKCVQCHRYFIGTNIKSLYCSSECKKESTKRKCVICNNDYYSLNTKKKTCSTECQLLYKNNTKTLSCKWCRRLFEMTEINHYNKNFFCSVLCRDSYYKNRKSNNVIKNKQSKLREKVKQDISSIRSLVLILIEPRLQVEKEFGFYHDVNQEHFSENLKEYVRKRDGYKCVICDYDQNLEVHHKIPRRLGGINHEDNLVTLCTSCHRAIETGDVDHATNKCFERYAKNHGRISLADYAKVDRKRLQKEINQKLDELFEDITKHADTKDIVKKIDLTFDLVSKIHFVK